MNYELIIYSIISKLLLKILLYVQPPRLLTFSLYPLRNQKLILFAFFIKVFVTHENLLLVILETDASSLVVARKLLRLTIIIFQISYYNK